MKKLNIAVAGLGVIGRRHVELINASTEACLSAIIDVTEASRVFAKAQNVLHFDSLESVFESHKPDGVILATPNFLHVSGALICAKNGVSALIEKPVAETVAEGERLLRGLAEMPVPMLVGHHRRYSATLQAAQKYIKNGHLGQLVSITGSAQFYKPDTYFEAGAWRKEKGGGTILINLIHEIDNLRFLCGDITETQIMASNTVRNFVVEDTAVMNFRFKNGTLGSFTLSDTAVLPMSWEQTSCEDKVYAAPKNHGLTDCYFIAGTEGGMAVPSMRTWRYEGERNWHKPLVTNKLEIIEMDPLVAQLQHFCAVIKGKAEPLVSPADALESLKIVANLLGKLKA
jgi:predicted dehydrogenase